MLLPSPSRAHVPQKNFSTLKLGAQRIFLHQAHSISLSPYVKADSICSIHSLWMNILLAKVRDTHRDHLCNYSSGVPGVPWVQILPFKLLVLSISFGMEARKECRTQHRVCCVMEMEGAGEMGLLTIGNNTDHTAKGSKKKTVTADKDMKGKMDKEVRRNTCNKHLPRSHWQWVEGNCTSDQEIKKSKPQLSEPWKND